MNMNTYEANPEFLIAPCQRGITLQRPDRRQITSTISVKAALNYPCNVYFLDLDSRVKILNEANANDCGFDSVQSAQGKTAVDCLSEESAAIVMASDKEVLQKQSLTIKNDKVMLEDEICTEFLTIKMPVYNNDQRISGIFGFSIKIGSQPLAESLTLIQNLGILTGIQRSAERNYKIDMSIFTRRQLEIISYLIRGSTAVEIGHIMQLSRRTVEHHIENIKCRLGVRTRSELFAAILD